MCTSLYKKNCLQYLIALSVVIVILAWVFQIYPLHWWAREIEPVPKFSWDGRIIFKLDNVFEPVDEADIAAKVVFAKENKRRIRVLADGHSWSKIAQTEDIMISLAYYTGLVSIDETASTATFKAGTPLRTMSKILESKGYDMIQLGSVAGQSIAGAISTGTHGTGLRIGNIAALVTKLKLINGEGTPVELSEGDPDFAAAQVSIGLLGVITEVTIKVKPSFKLAEKRARVVGGLDECLANMMEESSSTEFQYVKYWVDFHNKFCVLFQTKETANTEPIKGRPSSFISFMTYWTFAIVTRITYLWESSTPFFMKLVDWVGFGNETNRVDRSYLILNDYFELPVHQEGEVLVDYKDTVPVVRAIMDVIKRKRHFVNYITEIRFVAGDDAWLSPSYNRPNGICAITLTIYGTPERAERYFRDVYEVTADYNPRFHWGKHMYANSTELEDLYSKLNDFKELRKKYDPENVFVNTFFEETFDL